MKLSLVICTRNRSSQLHDALDSLERIHSERDWEIVLVDNGSTDDTSDVLKDFAHRHAGRVTVVSEPTQGLGRARNTGWRAASGDLIAFTDDDCYPSPDFVDRICQSFEDPDVGFLGGRILLYDPSDLPLTIQTRERSIRFEPRGFIGAGAIQGANFAFRREVLEDIDGFYNGFGAGTPFACEDVDAVARASMRGWVGFYDPAPIVYHHHRRKSQSDRSDLMKVYDTGRGAYYVKAMMIPGATQLYLENWLRMSARQNPIRTYREVKGGLRFLVRHIMQTAAHPEAMAAVVAD